LTNSLAPAEERLLIEAAQKDPRRFAELYELHFERVYAYVSRRVWDRAATEDITADVFHQALEHLPKFEWRGVPFAAWLYRIAANAIADHGRRQAREGGDAPAEAAGQPSGPAAEPDLEAIERRAAIYRLVRELPEDQRRVVVARFVEERRVGEIAAAMGRSEGAIKQLQFRALETLRARMREGRG